MPSDITMDELMIVQRALQLYTLLDSSNAACFSIVLFVHEASNYYLHSRTKNDRSFLHVHNDALGQRGSKDRSS